MLLFHFGDVPLVTLLANVLAAPAVAPALLLGLVAAGAALVWLPLGALLGLAAQVPMRYLELIANVAREGARSLTSPREGARSCCWSARRSSVALALALRTAGGRRGSRDRRGGGRPADRRVVLGRARRARPTSLTAHVPRRRPGRRGPRHDARGRDDPDRRRARRGAGRDRARGLGRQAARRPSSRAIRTPTTSSGCPAVLARIPRSAGARSPGARRRQRSRRDLDRAIADEGVPVRTPARGRLLTVGDLRIDVLSPDRCWTSTESDTNNDALRAARVASATTSCSSRPSARNRRRAGSSTTARR